MTAPATWEATIRARSGAPVQRIVLEVPAGFRFQAGQYLTVLHPDGPVPLSIASAPRRLPELHLHYRSTPGVAEAARMDELLERAGSLTLQGPAGDVRLPRALTGPALLIAGGTGIAQAWSFLDEFAEGPPEHPVSLLWSADRADDFYLRDELEALAGDWLALQLVADPRRDPRNDALAWLRAHAADACGGTEQGGPVILCGGPAFVYAACDALAAAGIDSGRLQSDVFSYAPRPPA